MEVKVKEWTESYFDKLFSIKTKDWEDEQWETKYGQKFVCMT